MTAGSAPKRLRHNEWPRTTTGAPSSASRKKQSALCGDYAQHVEVIGADLLEHQPHRLLGFDEVAGRKRIRSHVRQDVALLAEDLVVGIRRRAVQRSAEVARLERDHTFGLDDLRRGRSSK